MDTNHRRGSLPDPAVQFRLRWRGYDRSEVDQFVKESASHRQGHQGAVGTLDGSGASRHQDRADQVVAMAHRHADEIRAAAEGEAQRLVREAENQALLLHREQSAAHQHERECITALRDSIASCLETVSSALERARELTALRPDAEPSVAVSQAGSVAAVTEQIAAKTTDESPDRRRHAIYWIAVVVWCVLMLSILLLVSMKPTTVGASESAPVVREAERPASQPGPDRTVSSAAAPTIAAVEATALSVTFVANRDCWISITTDEGGANERLLKQDERVVIEADNVIAFKAGNAAALSILINDQPAGPLGSEGQVVTRRITRENYRTFLPPSGTQG